MSQRICPGCDQPMVEGQTFNGLLRCHDKCADDVRKKLGPTQTFIREQSRVNARLERDGLSGSPAFNRLGGKPLQYCTHEEPADGYWWWLPQCDLAHFEDPKYWILQCFSEHYMQGRVGLFIGPIGLPDNWADMAKPFVVEKPE